MLTPWESFALDVLTIAVVAGLAWCVFGFAVAHLLGAVAAAAGQQQQADHDAAVASGDLECLFCGEAPEDHADTDPPIYLDALAWSEATRADWDEPGRWQQ